MAVNKFQKKEIFHLNIDLLICFLLYLTIFAIYWQVNHYDFINYDDSSYITENRYVKNGLTIEGIKWAFTSFHSSNWHPITWLSHMLDVTLFGMNPGAHHLTNVFFHLANTLLLFFVFSRMTGHRWKSAFVAALFAFHPMHVESVTWVAERKDILCAFLWMLTLASYASYCHSTSLSRYLPVLLFFILGLMSKPMIVTLPFVLLILDYWPLNRLSPVKSSVSYSDFKKSISACWDQKVPFLNFLYLRLIIEKIPLFLLAAGSGIITIYAQQKGGAVASLHVLPFYVRIENTLIAYISYIGKMICPNGLAVFYPHALTFSSWKIAMAALLLCIIFYGAIKNSKQRPYILAGWLWYIGTLIPVIGLIQVGLQSMADRYTYIPFIGLFIIVAWGSEDLLRKWPSASKALFIIGGIMLTLLSIMAWYQVRHWRDDITLFSHAMNVTENNYVAYQNMGVALAKKGEIRKSLNYYYKALPLTLVHKDKLYVNIGNALAAQGKTTEAVKSYQMALTLNPKSTIAYFNIGTVLTSQGKLKEAIKYCSEALKIDQNFTKAHNCIGFALTNLGKTAQAKHYYITALRINPLDRSAFTNLKVLEYKSNTYSAIANTLELLRHSPEKYGLYFKLSELFGDLYKKLEINDQNNLDNRKSLSVQPEFIQAMIHLAINYALKGEYRQALRLPAKMIALRPNNMEFCYFIASLFARQNRPEKAIIWFKKALKLGFDNWSRFDHDNNMINIKKLVINHKFSNGQS